MWCEKLVCVYFLLSLLKVAGASFWRQMLYFLEKVAMAVTGGLSSEGSQSDFPLTGMVMKAGRGKMGETNFLFDPGCVCEGQRCESQLEKPLNF